MSDQPPTRRPNRLIDSRSPYLLQHAYNPVDWYPWGLEALALSRARDVPIFLSIGYSACHWCHVMEREVFENTQIARYMNEHFVNIKVDREQRPDLDELYMLATQIITGSGGWPMSVWLTPELKAFYAGTYFPPTDQYGRPGFPSVLSAITKAWRDQRSQVLQQAEHIAGTISQHLNRGGNADAAVDVPAWIAGALETCNNRMDLTWGGMTGAPKFPPHQTLLLWITLLEQQAGGKLHPAITISAELTEQIRSWLTLTLDTMAAGGIYDQIGGGFSRYSTDEQWLVPHFEKMLYDNAQLALVYARAGMLLKRDHDIQIARETLDFWLRDMTASDGLFYSSLDADSEGEEGKFYVWDFQEILTAIPDSSDRQLAGEYWDFSPEGNWEGCNIARVKLDITQLAARSGQAPDVVQERLEKIRSHLLKIRSTRIAPHCDDKILTDWNGLMIQALAEVAVLTDEPRYYQAAARAAAAILAIHRDAAGNRLHVSRDGQAEIPAFLQDEACFGLGVWHLAVAARHFAPQDSAIWMAAAKRAGEVISADFFQQQSGKFYISSERHEQLFLRVPGGSDNAVPSAAAMAMNLLLKINSASPKADYHTLVGRSLAGMAPLIEQYPLAFSSLLSTVVEHPEYVPTVRG